MAATFVKKMSVAALGCDPKEARQNKYKPGSVNTDGTPNPLAGKKVPLCIIYGRATGTKSGENRQTGDVWTALTGTFEGVCIQEGPDFKTGEVYTSGMVFLPGGIQEAIEGALEGAGENGSVEFAIKLFAGFDEKSAVGYRYYGMNMKAPAATDDLAGLRSLMQSQTTAQIAAPVPDAAPDSAPVPDAAPAAEPSKEAGKPAAAGKGKK